MALNTAVPKTPDGLYFHKVSKIFGGTRALIDVTINVKRGEIVALLGENGAGKSTLIKILGGIHTPDSGSVVIDRVPYRHTPGNAKVRQAVAFIHQDLGLIEWMSITENMALSVGYQRKFGLIDWRACEELTRQALARVGCHFSPGMRVNRLSRAEKSLVAIARALAVDCDYLVLDEPTASLPVDDVELLFKVLKKLRDDGVGLIYVSQRLDEVIQVSDRLVVLRDGRTVGAYSVNETNTEELVKLIIGRKPKTFCKLDPPTNRSVMLSVSNLRTTNTGPVSLQVYTGEMLALVGLRGAGQEDIGRCLFGATDFQGDILLDNKPYQPCSPHEAMRRGIGLVSRDREEESVAGTLTTRENLFLNPEAMGRGKFSFLTHGKEHQMAKKTGLEVGLRPNNPELPIDVLSGGNQQKVILGRWLGTNTRILIAEDPTAGIDVGAKAEIYLLLNKMVLRGIQVVIISSDFEEVAAICQRAIVFNRGLCTKELQGNQLHAEALVHYASVSDYKAQA